MSTCLETAISPLGKVASYLFTCFRSHIPRSSHENPTSSSATISLEDLSTELLAIVASHLDFQDVCNLRLVSRDMSVRGNHGLLKSDFAERTVAWNCVDQLEDLVSRTRSGWKGCLMPRLTVTCIIDIQVVARRYTDMELPANPVVAQELLVGAFENIRRNAPDRALRSLRLHIQYRDGTGAEVSSAAAWDESLLWHNAGRTYDLTISALAISGLPVLELQVFTDAPRCSLECDTIGLPLRRAGLDHAMGSHLTHLSLVLSNNTLRSQDPQTTGPGVARAEAEPMLDVYRFIELCRSLQDLRLRWFEVGPGQGGTRGEQSSVLLEHLSGLCNLAQLRECHLKGFYTAETTLSAFLLRLKHVRELRLEEFHLLHGTFQPVFDFLTCNQKQLQHLYLEDLWERAHIVCYGALGRRRFPNRDYPLPQHMVWEPAMGRGIKYECLSFDPYSSPWHHRWIQWRRAQYGSPHLFESRGHAVRPPEEYDGSDG